MGRKRKYHTAKEKRDAQRKWQMEHYKRNAEEIKAKARQRYRDKKKSEFYDKKIQDLYSNLDT
jgi:hypothetical protein|tara:strand:- start:202 stop:390 length:189 start_codon:yes stop_codon:yes gene_type:complete